MSSNQSPSPLALCAVFCFTPMIFLLAFMEGMTGVIVGPLSTFIEPVSPELNIGVNTERLINWLLKF